MESLIEISKENSLLNEFIAELRDVNLQKDKHRFRENLEQIGFLMAYEISKHFAFKTKTLETPLAKANVNLVNENIVILGILRASLPMQMGFLKGFRKADAAFLSAYRKNTIGNDFEIITEYEAVPSLKGKTVIIADPMCATGSSLLACYNKLTSNHQPFKVIFASIFASKEGIEILSTELPHIVHYTCVVDPELNAKKYIIPGLGDAGDLAFGEKL